MSMTIATYEKIAWNLREFGYRDVSAAMIRDVHEAMGAGKKLPHGVVGMFAQNQLEEAENQGLFEEER